MAWLFHYFLFLLLFRASQFESWVGTDGRLSGPIVLGDAGPEHPYGDNGQQGEERLEEGAINPAVCASADVPADGKLKDLADGKEDRGREEVHYPSRSHQQACFRNLSSIVDSRYSHIGFFSPNTRRTNTVSSTKNTTRHTSGKSR